ncbi:RNA-binding protein [Mariprofundus erugo]|uniref:RNA-binding protein n=1 Tax=Mariprofundus erugo TaxID=2528639 RepID=A0A5R9GVH3_9PROT|nr:RNA-binding protein [Mariprofundus erugo]TLS68759.1 RNA-binding protein [Mariprofundus erugo]TLS77551.1 RNA-binding protein [Mariprofundus erugo]
MSFSCFIKLFAAALVLSLLGYYSAGLFGMETPAGSVFATGLLIGCVAGGLLVALYPVSSADESDTDAASSGTSNLYVGNLPFNAGPDDIKNLFAPYGEVVDIRMVKDRRSKRFKGYAFVEMNSAGAQAAIKHLDNNDYAGRTLRVNEAQKKGEA